MEKIYETNIPLEDDCDMITYVRGKGAAVPSTVQKDKRTPAQRKADTESANDNKPKPPTDKDILKCNADLVKLLKNSRFIKESTGGKYCNYLAFYDNVPNNIVSDVKEIGLKRLDGRAYTRETISRVVTAMKIERRFQPFTVWLIGLAVCFLSVFATVKISQIPFEFGSVGGGNGVLTSSFGGGQGGNVDGLIDKAAIKNGVKVYPFRRNKIKNEIQLSGDNSLKNIELIINNNINELKNIR